MATRRAFLAGLAAAALPRMTWADAGSPAWLAAGKAEGGHVLHGLSLAGDSVFSLPLPARGHAAAAHPVRPLAVAFARRPGTFALVLDCARGHVTHRLTPPPGRQFNGHGAFSADGTLLMTSEVVAESSAGRIGLWETSGFTRVGEWDSGGIGPHDLKRLPDGRIVVANGGIATDPQDRSKLNLDTMRPNLAFLSDRGAVEDLVELPPDLHRNSIRHLALLPDGVAFAMQWEGDPAEPVPLLGLWRNGAVRLCEPDPAEMFTMQGYAGSIAAVAGKVAISSPRGGAVMVFAADGRPLATHRRADICGLAPLDGDFIASDGGGGLWRVAEALHPLRAAPLAWDNHIVPV
ncbi:DUF1513 domain-containing protein [Ruixingdingia sedimenti]|uniref:DUF1513 domain-containing protein n=1 Tax=Ruixingdingia sedimenti TaxID=3073604 RepID=A0ABU1F6M2_9RHOB|nr:DUF1513 domain-containing protein [Xinfangfangia sp. LG-4]MDR5652526.1 DUF1513 domain-containing protein [Xinfangfangia sp. LG-4]